MQIRMAFGGAAPTEWRVALQGPGDAKASGSQEPAEDDLDEEEEDEDDLDEDDEDDLDDDEDEEDDEDEDDDEEDDEDEDA